MVLFIVCHAAICCVANPAANDYSHSLTGVVSPQLVVSGWSLENSRQCILMLSKGRLLNKAIKQAWRLRGVK